MKVRDVIKMIENDGWALARTRGDHRQYKHPNKSGKVTLPGHPSDEMPPGTLKSVLRQALAEMMKYTVLFEKAPNNWAAYVPDLPGCVTTGRTLEETRRRIAEAIEFHIEGLRIDGEAVPEPATVAESIEIQAA